MDYGINSAAKVTETNGWSSALDLLATGWFIWLIVSFIVFVLFVIALFCIIRMDKTLSEIKDILIEHQNNGVGENTEKDQSELVSENEAQKLVDDK